MKIGSVFLSHKLRQTLFDKIYVVEICKLYIIGENQGH